MVWSKSQYETLNNESNAETSVASKRCPTSPFLGRGEPINFDLISESTASTAICPMSASSKVVSSSDIIASKAGVADILLRDG